MGGLEKYKQLNIIIITKWHILNEDNQRPVLPTVVRTTMQSPLHLPFAQTAEQCTSTIPCVLSAVTIAANWLSKNSRRALVQNLNCIAT